jgi:hypothetical protein
LASWSPDGQWIAYNNDGVCLVSPDGQKHLRLTKGIPAQGWLLWSPDGRFIVYRNGYSIHSLSVDGKVHVRLLTGEHFPPSYLHLGDVSWFRLEGQTGLLLHFSGLKDAFLPESFKSNKQNLLQHLLWIAPDGSRGVLFSVGEGLPTFWARVRKHRATDSSYVRGVYADGGQLGLQVGGPAGRGGPPSFGCALLDLRLRRVTVWSAPEKITTTGPMPSPDGRWFAYGSYNHGITVVSADAKRKTYVNCGRDPLAWSPDSQWIYVFEPDAGHAGTSGQLVAINWQRQVKRYIFHDERIGPPTFEEGAKRVRFCHGGPAWGTDQPDCWADPQSSPPVIHVIWPRRGTIRFAADAPEIPIPDRVVDVEPEVTETADVTLIKVQPEPAPLPASPGPVPVQVLELQPE